MIALDLSSPHGSADTTLITSQTGGREVAHAADQAWMSTEMRRRAWIRSIHADSILENEVAMDLCRRVPGDFIPKASAKSLHLPEDRKESDQGDASSEWEIVHRPSDGKQYFWNKRTNETTWKMPKELRKLQPPKGKGSPAHMSASSAKMIPKKSSLMFEFAQERVAKEALDIFGMFVPPSRRSTAAFCLGFGGQVRGIPCSKRGLIPMGTTALLDRHEGSDSASPVAALSSESQSSRASFSLRKGSMVQSADCLPCSIAQCIATPSPIYELHRPAGALHEAPPSLEDAARAFMMASRLRGPDAIQDAYRRALFHLESSFGASARSSKAGVKPNACNGADTDFNSSEPILQVIDAAVSLTQLDSPSTGRQRYCVCVVCMHRAPCSRAMELI